MSATSLRWCHLVNAYGMKAWCGWLEQCVLGSCSHGSNCLLAHAMDGRIALQYLWLAPQQISTGFESWLCYCSNVVHRRPTNLCTMFGRLLGWYTIYTFSGGFCPLAEFARCKFHFAFKSCILLYWQHYCTALNQWVPANFAVWYNEWNYGTFADSTTYILLGGPSLWVSTHILVPYVF